MGAGANLRLLYAPDVAKGPDGRYYLYYSLDFTNVISVAVGDSPAGPFEYKGVIVSNGDLGYEGNELAVNYTGNNHGGLAEIRG